VALRLTIGFSDQNPRVEPLKDGTVKPQNIELGFSHLDPSALFQRNLFYDEFDVSEMSISETLLARERTRRERKWDWSALPIYLAGDTTGPTSTSTQPPASQSCRYEGQADRRADYDMTAALWFRNTLKDLYGIEAKDNVWFNGRHQELSHGGALGLDRQDRSASPTTGSPWIKPRRNARRGARSMLHGDRPSNRDAPGR